MNQFSPALPQLLNRLRMRQVALLLAMGEGKTLGAAAKDLGMTQPAATKMLAEVETTLGQVLFDRVGRGLRINAAGRATLACFQSISGTLEQLQRGLSNLKQGLAGQLAIGSLMAASPTHLTKALALMQLERPHLNIQIEVGDSDSLMNLLDQGALDVVIGRMSVTQAHHLFRPLAKEAIALVCAPNHPLALRRRVSFDELQSYAWVLQPEGTAMRDVVSHEFLLHHAALPSGLLETSSAMITVHLVTQSQMIAGLPQSVARGFQKHGMLKILPYRLQQDLSSYGSIVRSDRPLTDQTEEFLRILHRK